jgi:hypothetical protein
MKNFLKPLSVACTAMLLLTACTKEAKEATADYVSDEALSKIQSLGFGTQGVKKIAAGYLVEGDIILTEAEINSNNSTASLLIAQEEQYHTFNLASASKHPVINVALNLSNTAYSAAFGAALDEAIARYNAENLQIRFQRVTTGADITVVGFYENSNTLGSAGFPNSAGDPYPEVRMNTYHYSTGTDATNVNYIATIMSHEMGHCIGFRHTDYMSRRYSCGYGGNEGQSSTGVGAVHIPGTPTKGDPNSFMLACIGSYVNRPFNANDKIALDYLW